MARRRPSRGVCVLAWIFVAGAAFGAGCSEDRKKSESAAGAPTPTCDRPAVIECAPQDSVLGPMPSTPQKATGSPLKVRMLNQESGAGGAFPELSLADVAAVRFINDELGGVDGHPIEFSVCDTKFSTEASTACARQAVQDGVVAVAGGIDIFGDGIKILEDNDIPFVGGIPISTLSATSPISFQFSGGTWGAVTAFVDYSAKTLDAHKLSIVYGEFGSIADAAKLGERIGTKLGIDVKLVPTPIVTNDYLTPLTAANDPGTDAIVALTADVGCVPTFQAAKSLNVKGAMFYTGACASPKILAAAGDENTEGSYFNVEGPIDADHPSPDNTLYFQVMDKYAPEVAAQSSGTVSFRAMMNLYLAMKQIGGDRVTAQALIDFFRDARAEPSFAGHRYTCDGKQLPEQPAMCAPEQIIGRRQDGMLVGVTDWIDVPKIVNG